MVQDQVSELQLPQALRPQRKSARRELGAMVHAFTPSTQETSNATEREVATLLWGSWSKTAATLLSPETVLVPQLAWTKQVVSVWAVCQGLGQCQHSSG